MENSASPSVWLKLRWIFATLSGLLQALIFPPFDLGWICWFPLAFLLAALWLPETAKGPKGRTCFTLGFLSGCGLFLGSLHWLVTVSVAGWIALSLYLALYPALWALAAGTWLRPGFAAERHPLLSSLGNIGRAAALAALWVALEYLRGTLFSGFGWNTLGLGLRDNLALAQIASITGSAGLSFLAAFGAVTLYCAARRFSVEAGNGPRRVHFEIHTALLLVALTFVFGVKRLRVDVPTQPLKIALVQANIPQEEKWDAEFAQEILRTYDFLTDTAAAGKPDLIIWPEAATPMPLFGDEQTFTLVTKLAVQNSVPLMLGTLDFEDTPETREDFNAAMLIPPQPGRIQVYRKMHLVPFGEFIPFRKTFPPFEWIAGGMILGDFVPGKQPVVFELWNHHVSIAPLICFEDTLGELVTHFVHRGAQLLVNVTNDGWFAKSAGAEQHLASAQLRTVETGLPMVRAANTGVSCFIDRSGRIYRELRDENGTHFTRGTFADVARVPLHPQPTFYVLHGDLFSHLCIVVSLLPLLLAFARRARPASTA